MATQVVPPQGLKEFPKKFPRHRKTALARRHFHAGRHVERIQILPLLPRFLDQPIQRDER
jgi:hypothetical protein